MNPNTRLRKAREQAGITLQKLADKAGTTPQAIHYLEVNGIQQLTTARRYAKALGINPCELLEW